MLATSLALRSDTTTIHNKLVAHITASKDASDLQSKENSDIVASMQSLLQAIDDNATSRFDALQTRVKEYLHEMQGLREQMIQGKEHVILRWLHFRQQRWRFDAIPLVYQRTFEWIFRDDGGTQRWDNFASFLKDENIKSPYFVNGKAGSGKSTLMKFIVDHSRTSSLLEEWARNKDLVILKFFFWNLGTAMQKSSVGMLRTLLYIVLSRYPELIQRVFPELYEGNEDLTDVEPTYEELNNALQNLQQATAYSHRLCIFIDGIDEYAGDHKDMSLFLRGLVSPNVKVVVSSRPINACLNAFADSQTLNLHHLTKKDMSIFINGELCSHRMMEGYQRRYPNAVKEIVEELETRAEGVFLWVKLVVKILTDGLENGDGIHQLKKKLYSLPSGLRELYNQMLGRLQPEYRVEAAQIFQLHGIWSDATQAPLQDVIMSFALEHPWMTNEFPRPYMDQAESEWITQTIGARIRSRCCGLLELRQERTTTIEYIHRTVAEFTRSEEIWKEICNITTSSAFDSTTYLVQACTWVIKSCYNVRDEKLRPHLTYAIQILRSSNFLPDNEYMSLIDHVDRTMAWTLLRDELPGIRPGSPQFQGQPTVHWSRSLNLSREQSSQRKKKWLVEGMEDSANILTFATVNGMTRYLEVCHSHGQISSDFGPILVMYAISGCSPQSDQSPYSPLLSLRRPDWVATLEYLLRNVAGPESKALDREVFGVALQESTRMGNTGDAFTLLLLFLGTAASPKHLCYNSDSTKKLFLKRLQAFRDIKQTSADVSMPLFSNFKPRSDPKWADRLENMATLEGPAIVQLEEVLQELDTALSIESLSSGFLSTTGGMFLDRRLGRR